MFCPLFNTRFKLLLSFQEEQGVDHGKLAAIVLYHQQWLALAEAWSLMLAVLCLNCAAVLAFKGVVCCFNIIQFLLLHTLHEVKMLSLLTMLKLATVTSFSGFSSMWGPLTDCRVRVVGDTVVVGVVLKKVLP